MKIQTDPHTLLRAKERGTDEKEIEDVLMNGKEGLAKGQRRMKFKTFLFNSSRGGKHYDQKRVEVYYIEEGDKIITVTVYVFYGKWEE
jgi:Domain of unknown function (DUF4258)